MKLHQLKPAPRRRRKKRLGRGPGSGKGTYSGRGIKGQKSRSGYKIPGSPLFTKLPKLRGERMKKIAKEKPAIVNLSVLEKKYRKGEEVSLKSLITKKLIDKKAKKAKILADGKLTKQLKFSKELLFSKKVREKIA